MDVAVAVEPLVTGAPRGQDPGRQVVTVGLDDADDHVVTTVGVREVAEQPVLADLAVGVGVGDPDRGRRRSRTGSPGRCRPRARLRRILSSTIDRVDGGVARDDRGAVVDARVEHHGDGDGAPRPLLEEPVGGGRGPRPGSAAAAPPRRVPATTTRTRQSGSRPSSPGSSGRGVEEESAERCLVALRMLLPEVQVQVRDARRVLLLGGQRGRSERVVGPPQHLLGRVADHLTHPEGQPLPGVALGVTVVDVDRAASASTQRARCSAASTAPRCIWPIWSRARLPALFGHARATADGRAVPDRGDADAAPGEAGPGEVPLRLAPTGQASTSSRSSPVLVTAGQASGDPLLPRRPG